MLFRSDGAIINPNSVEMMSAYRAYRVISGQDAQSRDYIASYQNTTAVPAPTTKGGVGLQEAICKGLREDATREAQRALTEGKPILDLLNGELIPALDKVGKDFESGTLFLPQLLMSAEAAKDAFAILKAGLPATEGTDAGLVVLATVKGDIHDIGKNIVKVLLESYRFRVLDLGKDVAPERIVEAVREHNIQLVGLSALMTTTAPYMAETIRQLRDAGLACQVVVGGAVVTQSYADSIGADYYAADAMETVHLAQNLFAEKK